MSSRFRQQLRLIEYQLLLESARGPDQRRIIADAEHAVRRGMGEMAGNELEFGWHDKVYCALKREPGGKAILQKIARDRPALIRANQCSRPPAHCNPEGMPCICITSLPLVRFPQKPLQP